MKALITFEVEVPRKCTKKQFETWLKFELGKIKVMSNNNPLCQSNQTLDFSTYKMNSYPVTFTIVE